MGIFRKCILIFAFLVAPPIAMAGIMPFATSLPHQQLRNKAQKLGVNLRAFDRTFSYLHQNAGLFENKNYVTIIDYTKPSAQKRMYVFDLRRNTITPLLVAHGRRSGGNESDSFSNRVNSYKSSLGFMKTGAPYRSHDVGPALVLYGLEDQNSHLYERKIVIHGAWYVSTKQIQRRGYLGRSLGCPAVEKGVIRWLISKIKGGSLIYSFYE